MKHTKNEKKYLQISQVEMYFLNEKMNNREPKVKFYCCRTVNILFLHLQLMCNKYKQNNVPAPKVLVTKAVKSTS